MSAVRLSVATFAALAVNAQGTVEHGFWPETDLYWQFNPSARLVATAQESRDRDVSYRDVELGTYVDYYIPKFRPILFRQFVERDEARRKRIVVQTGFLESRSLSGQSVTVEERPVIQATFRWVVPWDLLLSDRNRFEFRIINGAYSWRYRNEFKVEKDLKIRGLPMTGYVSSEEFFDSKGDIWNRFRYKGGVLMQVERWVAVEPYYARQSTSNVQPRNENALGLTLSFYVN